MIRILARLLTLALLAVVSDFAVPAARQPATAWILERDDVLISAHQADVRLPTASLAKLMTAIVWIQKPERLDATINISVTAAAATGSRAGLHTGEHYRGRDLLAAMLIKSGNDACIALAQQAAASVAQFVRDMNAAAALLDLPKTHFANPCGWDAPEQRSSARDLLALAKLAMEYPQIRALVALPEYRLQAIGSERVMVLHNSNALLTRLAGTHGVKTGYTAQAGKCLIAWVERDSHQVWLVLLAAPERWWTAHALIEAAFNDAGGR